MLATTATASAATHETCPITDKAPAITRNGVAGTGAPMRAASVAAKTSQMPWLSTREISSGMGLAACDLDLCRN